MRKLWLLLAVPIVVLDQLVKWWVSPGISECNHCHAEDFFPISLFPGIELTYAENTGAAFSLLSGGGAIWFLAAVSTLAAVLIIVAVCKRWIWSRFGVIAASCVLGGAVGNLICRVLRGYVVDMFAFTFVDFAIFNVADIFITVGGAGFVLSTILDAKKETANAPVDENG
jgi:signal peptidase II